MRKYSGMLEDFLSTDINENLDFCDEVLEAIERAQTQEDSFCGNVYELEIAAGKATLHNLHDDEVEAESIDLAEMKNILLDWRKKIARGSGVKKL